ncbi:alpha/beta hydrolase [Gorillibacterium sp. sgz500922]|uniref:alpha/beta hydrolase n=1 Tax=Gorillibacterium sp. sgz500922 TaxID=3446694 RepID=UPI003F660F0B
MNRKENTETVRIGEIALTKAWAGPIPVLYREPESVPAKAERKLAIFLTGLGGTKEKQAEFLKDIAERGYVALAFDNAGHGERGTEARDDLVSRVFGNMRREGWKVLGQTVLDTSAVIDWAVTALGVSEQVRMGGISMGGDITIAAAGVDRRIVRAAPIITTPDWLRPGMREISSEAPVMDPGAPDEEAQAFYDRFNPITHLDRYVDGPPMRLTLGAEDRHIPPENAERFKRELGRLSGESADRIELVYVPAPQADHADVIRRKAEWWPSLLDWWLND